MAQHEINIEAGIVPVLDQRSADAVMKRLQTMLTRLGTAQHTALAQEFQNLFGQAVASRVASGRATTATSARIAMEQSLGIRGGSAAKALAREAADMAALALKQGRVSPYTSFSPKQIKMWRSDLGGAATAYNDMLKSYEAFKIAPNKETQSELIKAITLVNTQLANMSKDRKAESKTVDKIEKDAKAIHKETKDFTKPTETGNKVYDYACKKFGKKFKTMDEILEYVAKQFTYQFYYDDQKSNKQVTDRKSGNCTDLLQWLINMLEALGYEWKVLHVQCSSGVGHVRGMFKHKKHTENTWVYRDIAAVADGDGIRTNWCFSGFTLLSTNPSWFLENLRR